MFGSRAPSIPATPAPDPEVQRMAAEEEAKRKRRATFQASLLRSQETAPADVLGG